jgi:sugar-specific transcriptional regulator TrmB
MATAQTKNYSMDDYKAKYNDIVALCDCAEELLATVENSAIVNPQEQLDMIEPLINEIADSSDVLAEEFLLVAESNKTRSPSKFSKKRIESALRRICVTLNEYQENVQSLTKKSNALITNITKPIIKKIQQQLDKVIVIFFEFAQISLQSIMSKVELDAIKIRNSDLALMMHQSNLSLQQS